MTKILRYLYQKFVVTRRISELQIKEAGLDSDGHAFVTLKDGMTFYGPKPAGKEKKFYSTILSKSVKNQLPFHCYQVAIDIVIRFYEGNLKWGGPAKEAFYHVKEGNVIAEMGAFRGYYTLYLSKKVGPDGHIIAIEPIPDNIEYLRKNIAINEIENVTIVPKGVWNENDQKTFQRKTTDYQSGSIDIVYQDQEALVIEVNTLDKILSDQKVNEVDFMLIQLNGAEFEALEGLSKSKPKNLAIASRYNKNQRNIAREIQELLMQRGYAINILNEKFIYAQLN
ncbi:FkbM family methyltransferase [Ekhidna sp.]|uniref:FkbM family methyltransferase n=1 Tax=Ekhidna sp. TaxID=2608089 RepID=UPI003B50EBEE